MKNKSITTYILWGIYAFFLASLLPNTAWAFANWEDAAGFDFFGLKIPQFINWILALAVELAIGTLTHKHSEKISRTPKSKKGWERIAFQYVNWFFFLLLMFTGVSVLANLAHAVEFGGQLKIFAQWGIDPKVFQVAFGGVLPIISLGFANVLSDVTEDEEAPNPLLEAAKKENADLKKQLRESELQRKATEDKVRAAEDLAKAAEQKVLLAEERLGTAMDMAKVLFGEDKRQRIVITKRQWPGLPNSAIAIIANASQPYVSEVLASMEVLEG